MSFHFYNFTENSNRYFVENFIVMKYFKFLLIIFSLTFISCTVIKKTSTDPIKYELSEIQKTTLISEVEHMLQLDQKYRDLLFLGTLDPEVIKKNAELSTKASFEEYMAFVKTVKKDITQTESDSLWKLQHELDYNNYISLKTIIAKYGYPSEQRLETNNNNVIVILLHPPVQLDPKKYLNEMHDLLIKEVFAKRMEANDFATFVDNIKAKILKEPQVYGTNNSFDVNTMKIGPPIIDNIKKTNKKRKEIGLQELKEGEYIIVKS